MGMAASQARYLALTARKTNIEYEGQQINQSRLMLSNQSANLFNQMLGMKVPTAPSSSDFTTIQYSYTDGINQSVIENYYQLGTANEDFNYVVTSYHYEDIYTGSRKQMVDPQIQALKVDKYTYNPTKDSTKLYVRAIMSPSQTGDSSYKITVADGSVYKFKPVDNNSTMDRNVVNAITGQELYAEKFSYDTTNDKYVYTEISAEKKEETNAFTVNYNAKTYTTVNLANIDSESQEYKNFYALYGTSFEEDVVAAKRGETPVNRYYYTDDNYYARNTGTAGETTEIYEITNTPKNYNKVNIEDEESLTKLKAVFGSNVDLTSEYYVDSNGNYVKADEINNGKTSTDYHNAKLLQYNSDAEYYTDGNYNYILKDNIERLTVGSDFEVMSAEYTPVIMGYSAIGNSKLTQVSADEFKMDKTISTEINQIIKDMQSENGNPISAENFAKCFNAEGEYIGGIYAFKMNGVTYYTTESDLYKSVASGYSSNIADNGIDGQQSKLAYYNATYLKTKVSETRKALLETDGKGRFSTIKFEDDSVVYALNTETITDNAAYDDAMNQYYYDQEVYDKAIADINARTEILQAQDRELELRLEQLNTEQSALQNEMEACKKVVDKHVEQGFKTFGG